MEIVQTWTADGLRLDGGFVKAPAASPGSFDAFCLVHGTGGNFYSSTLFDALGEQFLAFGASLLRINTRGHDGMSTAVTRQGGKRLGAAYEVVDDCRKDLAAWLQWLGEHGCRRVCLVGHSLGAVKCIYSLAQEPRSAVTAVLALSPPRLSYSWFCSSPEAERFLETYQHADSLMQAGRGGTLLEVPLPLPFVITAAGFVEKYGPDERYNFLPLLARIDRPLLVTYGSLEVENNMAFRAAPDAIREVARSNGRLQVATIGGGDHFYTGVRTELIQAIDSWLQSLQ